MISESPSDIEDESEAADSPVRLGNRFTRQPRGLESSDQRAIGQVGGVKFDTTGKLCEEEGTDDVLSSVDAALIASDVATSESSAEKLFRARKISQTNPFHSCRDSYR